MNSVTTQLPNTHYIDRIKSLGNRSKCFLRNVCVHSKLWSHELSIFLCTYPRWVDSIDRDCFMSIFQFVVLMKKNAEKKKRDLIELNAILMLRKMNVVVNSYSRRYSNLKLQKLSNSICNKYSVVIYEIESKSIISCNCQFSSAH